MPLSSSVHARSHWTHMRLPPWNIGQGLPRARRSSMQYRAVLQRCNVHSLQIDGSACAPPGKVCLQSWNLWLILPIQRRSMHQHFLHSPLGSLPGTAGGTATGDRGRVRPGCRSASFMRCPLSARNNCCSPTAGVHTRRNSCTRRAVCQLFLQPTQTFADPGPCRPP